VFAYEGWIIATSINAELKNPKKNLPLALIIGAGIVVIAYILYYIGVAGGASVETLISEGATKAFSNIFGAVGGTLLSVCIVVSCLGTLNGLMLATTRGMYSLAARGEGPNPKMFGQIDQTNNMTTNSSVWGLFVCAVWLLYFYGANLASNGGWFGVFNFDSSELPIVTVYGFYIPMFIAWMKKEKDLSVLQRFVLPMFAVIACVFMIFATVYAHGITPYLNAIENGNGFSFPVLFYLIVFVVVMFTGYFFSNSFKKILSKKKSSEREVNTTDEGETIV
jgi:APA family basic amino acid/polyamine antiporter